MIPHIDGKVNRVRRKNRPFGDLPVFCEKRLRAPGAGATIKTILLIVGGWSDMQLLEQRILAEGEVKSSEILKVDRFLNHQMDPKLFLAMAEEWKRLFDGCGVNKLVTIEASGIGIAAVAGLVFDCPVVFAKKTKSRNVSDDAYTTVVHSFTHGNDNTIRISREYLSPSDRVLVIDDFLANGAALDGLITLIENAGATVVGAGIAVEKAFQPGGARIRARGYRVESLARVQSMDPETGIVFC